MLRPHMGKRADSPYHGGLDPFPVVRMPFRQLLLVPLLLVLTACGPRTPSAPSLERNTVMPLFFPGWGSRDGQRVQTLHLEGAEGRFDVSPVQVVRLSDQRAVLVTAATEVDEHGEAAAGHDTPGVLGAYWLRRDGERWLADGRQDDAGRAGFFGEVGSTDVVKLAAGRYALSVEYSSCWQGECGGWLALYELGEHRVRPLLGEPIALSALNSGSVPPPADCDAILAREPGTTERLPEEEERHACYEVTGSWQIVPGHDTPGDLVLDFVSLKEDYTAQPEDASAPLVWAVSSTRRATQRMIYRYRGDSYLPFSGSNPVPSF
ncbi:hypothetical protein GCM10007860_34220 [Chitiniphilus shinanonensis]|uniref:Lipoprotein n=1 Tax=Chitiniphilus shinanonensis TaxID=553088 RepID=A0ABQ6C180_9NEIS|nr:hypothetical protein [Chitiniphilus shinanonensis]GLS06247.1 hypothetical protein GCM10007860_34220 [Chitiniphilus shinanonensis]